MKKVLLLLFIFALASCYQVKDDISSIWSNNDLVKNDSSDNQEQEDKQEKSNSWEIIYENEQNSDLEELEIELEGLINILDDEE